MSNDENITYQIFADRLADVEAKLAKINKRADKLGVPSVELSVIESFVKKIEGDDYEMLKVTLSAESVKLAGWTFLATLQHTTEGNIVRAIPNADIDTTSYRTVDAYCAHCNTIRNRIDTYIVRHEDGTLKQVGSSCIKDFLGHDPKGALWMASFLADLDGFMEEFSERGERTKPVYALNDYLSWVAAEVRQSGWVSRSKARYEEKTPTADAADMIRFQYYKHGGDGKNPVFVTDRGYTTVIDAPTEKDIETAEKAIAWVRDSRETPNDYLYNLLMACSCDYISNREFGLAASAISAYQREVEKTIKAERQAAVSNWVGEVKERRDFTVTVEGVRYIEGAYGVTTLYSMVDGDGNVIKWFSSNDILTQGESYTLKGSVKAHDEWEGVKQTVITRCKIV